MIAFSTSKDIAVAKVCTGHTQHISSQGAPIALLSFALNKRPPCLL